MGSLTQTFGFLSAKPNNLTKARWNLTHIQETPELMKKRRDMKLYKKVDTNIK